MYTFLEVCALLKVSSKASKLKVSSLFLFRAAVAVETARNEWNSRKKDEVDLVLESTSTQLVKQFEKQKKEAVEKAVGEARV